MEGQKKKILARIERISFVLCLVGLMFGLYSLDSSKQKPAKPTIEELQTQKEALQAQFHEDIGKAIERTGAPCGPFYELVTPPEGLKESSVLIFMGQDAQVHVLVPDVYELRPNGEKVELWLKGYQPPGDPDEK